MEIVNVMAASLDGHIAMKPLESDEQRAEYGFSIPEDKEFVRQQIHHADAIITGADSMRASSGTWQEMRSKGGFPHWVVITTKGLDANLRFWQQHDIPRVLVSPRPLSQDSLQDARVPNWVPRDGQSVVDCAVENLASLGVNRVLLFGGGAVNNLFYRQGLVNELNITVCPFFLAGNKAPRLINPPLEEPVKFELISSQVVRSHVFLRYQVIYRD